MKATTWLFPVLTLLCATRLVCTAQRGTAGKFNAIGRYPMDYAGPNMLQEQYLYAKRNKPSLSIVNPLDVLRQRLLLEIARRQMKENTRQVELNRAILKNVGKRMSTAYERYPWSQWDGQRSRYQQHQQPLLLLQQHYPVPMEYSPQASALDALLQRPMLYNDMLTNADVDDDDDENNAIDGDNDEENAIGVEKKSNRYPIIANGIDNEAANRKDSMVTVGNGALKTATEHPLANGKPQPMMSDDSDELNDGYQLRYLYRSHQNHPTKM